MRSTSLDLLSLRGLSQRKWSLELKSAVLDGWTLLYFLLIFILKYWSRLTNLIRFLSKCLERCCQNCWLSITYDRINWGLIRLWGSNMLAVLKGVIFLVLLDVKQTINCLFVLFLNTHILIIIIRLWLVYLRLSFEIIVVLLFIEILLLFENLNWVFIFDNLNMDVASNNFCHFFHRLFLNDFKLLSSFLIL